MRRNPSLANVDFPIRKKLAQMVIGPAVAEPEFKHVPVQFPDEVGRQIEASALSLQSAYEAIEPAHGRSSHNTSAFAQSFDLGKRRAQLMVRQIESVRQLLHD